MKIITVENISKRYRVGVAEKRADTLAGQIVNGLKYPLQNFNRLRKLKRVEDSDDESVFWALRDLNFHVDDGEVLGVIGHNGAGKSTLLKILSRITLPSDGRIRIKGRVSSLLEVGTGFHPDLTGYDNIFMNGTLLGMKKREVDEKLEEIIAFSGVEKHLYTPIKRYSSGMKVRLAFSVAAHLEPEILIIDEVLAVGDQEFQKKCLGKMKDVAGSGRTVLFVSHNMTAVKSLCNRAILLDHGQKVFDGDVEKAISKYLKVQTVSDNYQRWNDLEDAPGNEKVKVNYVEVRKLGGHHTDSINMDDPVEVLVGYHKFESEDRVDITLEFIADGDIIFTISSSLDNVISEMPVGEGEHVLRCLIPSNFFNTGTFSINVLSVRNYRNLDFRLEQLIEFAIVDKKVSDGRWLGKTKGYLRPRFSWELLK